MIEIPGKEKLRC